MDKRVQRELKELIGRYEISRDIREHNRSRGNNLIDKVWCKR